MNTLGIHFDDDFELPVSWNCNNETFKGQLIIKKAKLPIIKFHSIRNNILKSNIEKNDKSLICQSSKGDYSFYECDTIQNVTKIQFF